MVTVACTRPTLCSRFSCEVALADSSTAGIRGVAYHSDLSLTILPTLHSSDVNLLAVDVGQLIGSLNTDVVLATLTVQATAKGASSVDIALGTSFGVQQENGATIRLIGTVSGTLTVPNSAPVVTVATDQTVTVGSALSLTVASFTDANPGDTHTAIIDWGEAPPNDGVDAS